MAKITAMLSEISGGSAAAADHRGAKGSIRGVTPVT